MTVKSKFENIEDFLFGFDEHECDYTYSVLCTYDDAVEIMRYYFADDKYTISFCYLTNEFAEYDGEYLIGVHENTVFCEKADVGKGESVYLRTDGIVYILPGCSEEAIVQYDKSAEVVALVSFMDDDEIEKADNETGDYNSEDVVEITNGEGTVQAVMKDIYSKSGGVDTHFSIYFSSNDEEQVKYVSSLLKEK